MKNLNFKIAMAFVAGFFLFSCSNENDVLNNMNVDDSQATSSVSPMSADEEAAAYQDLFVQLNSLNEKYAMDPQTRVVGGKAWLDNTFKEISTGILGGVMVFRKDLFERIVSAVAATVRANPQSAVNQSSANEDVDIMGLYLARIGASAADFDAAGKGHNDVFKGLARQYSYLKTMSDAQLQSVILQQMIASGYRLPEKFNSFTFAINFTQINSVVQTNNYVNSLSLFVNYNFITSSEYSTMVSFLNGLRSVTRANVQDYCVNFRNTVYNSGIIYSSKSSICSVVSIGFASAHLWNPLMTE